MSLPPPAGGSASHDIRLQRFVGVSERSDDESLEAVGSAPHWRPRSGRQQVIEQFLDISTMQKSSQVNLAAGASSSGHSIKCWFFISCCFPHILRIIGGNYFRGLACPFQSIMPCGLVS
jgi:hypothetical protein